MNCKIRSKTHKRNTKTNKRTSNKRKRNTTSNKRKTNKRRRTFKMKKRNTRKSRKIQYGGKFNDEQIEDIKNAINQYQHIEPFTEDEIKHYIGRLNDISQRHALNFDDFYWNMIQHLEGGEDRTFKQWIDMAYPLQIEQVETDKEVETEDEENEEDEENQEI